MTNETPRYPLVEGGKRATVHFAKAAIEVAGGVGALWVAVFETVRPRDEGTDDESGLQKVPIE